MGDESREIETGIRQLKYILYNLSLAEEKKIKNKKNKLENIGNFLNSNKSMDTPYFNPKLVDVPSLDNQHIEESKSYDEISSPETFRKKVHEISPFKGSKNHANSNFSKLQRYHEGSKMGIKRIKSRDSILIDMGESVFNEQNQRELLKERKKKEEIVLRKRNCCCWTKKKSKKIYGKKLDINNFKTKELWIWLLRRIGLAVKVINALKRVKKDIEIYGAMGESLATKYQRKQSALIVRHTTRQTNIRKCVCYIYIYIFKSVLIY